MTYTLNDNFADLPQSGDADLPVAGQAVDSYRAWRMVRNANYLIANRANQVVGSGNNNEDYGTLASVTTDTWFQNTAASLLLRHRGRALVWEPHDSVRLVFRAAKVAAATDPKVRLYVSPEPWASDEQAVPNGSSYGDAAVTTTDLDPYSIILTSVPINSNDRMLYWYICLQEIEKVGSWTLYMQAYDG